MTYRPAFLLTGIAAAALAAAACTGTTATPTATVPAATLPTTAAPSTTTPAATTAAGTPASTGASGASSATGATGATGTAAARVKISANTATAAEIQAALTAAGVPNPANWTREVMEYRPYPADDANLGKLRQNLVKYNPGAGVVDAIVSALKP